MARRRGTRITPGDGSELRPVTGLQWLWRGQFAAEVDGHEYAVDVDYLDWDERSRLYRDGVQVAVGGNPARFDLGDLPDGGSPTGAARRGRTSQPGDPSTGAVRPARPSEPGGSPTGAARIETRMSFYGMSRAHVVTPAGEQQMRPAPGTGEAWRADLDRDRPGLSRVLGAVSLLVLLVALGLEIPQLLEGLSRTDWWAQLTDWRPSAPVQLPPWANGTLTAAGVLAGLERALRLRHTWLLDD